VDADSRTRLLEAIGRANIQAHEVLGRRTEGDFSPDPKAGRFPELQSSAVQPVPSSSAETVTLSDLFDLWKADHLLGGGPEKTARDFRQKLDSLIQFLGHEDAQRVEARLIADWTAHLRHEEGLSARTVGQKYLVAIKRIFTVGKRKFRITDNPAADVVVEVPKTKRTRSSGFSDNEAKTILSAALTAPEALHRWSRQNRLAIRWAPWLCAYNGARITEMMQLRKKDVETHSGIPCLRITPEAASTKTGNFRLVPIHPHLVEMGFLDFVQSRPDGYVFFDLEPGQNAKTRAQSIGVKVRDWVRDVVKIEDPGVQPNHGWRHRFKTIAREVGIPPDYIDAMQGHEDGRASADYGDFTAKLLAPEIAKLPRYDVDP
jgi:integrase